MRAPAGTDMGKVGNSGCKGFRIYMFHTEVNFDGAYRRSNKFEAQYQRINLEPKADFADQVVVVIISRAEGWRGLTGFQ